MARAGSIQRRLLWSLSIGQVVALTLGTAAIFLSLALLVPRLTNGVDPVVREVETSLTSDAAGDLNFKSDPRAQAGLRENPGFWCIVRLDDGRGLRFGPIPPDGEALGAAMSVLPRQFAQFGASRRPTTSFAPLHTQLGDGAILYGGLSFRGAILVALSAYFGIIFIPLLIASVLAPIVIIPLAVRRGMAGLREATEAAEAIHFGVAGERLPTDNVPREVVGLVEAVNGALERLDIGQAQRQRFLIDAAHELRTPVAILQTRLEGMEPGPQTDRLLADLERLSATCEQLLDVQRLETRANRQALDLGRLAEDVVAAMAPLAIAAGYQLSFSAEARGVMLNGDEAALKRAVSNLVRNAIEHGGGAGDIQVRVTADRAIEVADQGPGVPEALREQIFQPFSRVHPRGKGAGLGLTLVRQIVELHGGSASAVASPSGGRFRLAFPTS